MWSCEVVVPTIRPQAHVPSPSPFRAHTLKLVNGDETLILESETITLAIARAAAYSEPTCLGWAGWPYPIHYSEIRATTAKVAHRTVSGLHAMCLLFYMCNRNLQQTFATDIYNVTESHSDYADSCMAVSRRPLAGFGRATDVRPPLPQLSSDLGLCETRSVCCV